jgi:hypothetical protein
VGDLRLVRLRGGEALAVERAVRRGRGDAGVVRGAEGRRAQGGRAAAAVVARRLLGVGLGVGVLLGVVYGRPVVDLLLLVWRLGLLGVCLGVWRGGAGGGPAAEDVLVGGVALGRLAGAERAVHPGNGGGQSYTFRRSQYKPAPQDVT